MCVNSDHGVDFSRVPTAEIEHKHRVSQLYPYRVTVNLCSFSIVATLNQLIVEASRHWSKLPPSRV
jgi:hypothetical protein